jgi:hypothetical protein
VTATIDRGVEAVEVKLFIKDDCPRCPDALRAVQGISALSVYNVGDMAGLAEASSWSVIATPSVLVVDSSGREVAGWRGEAPAAAQLYAVLAN